MTTAKVRALPTAAVPSLPQHASLPSALIETSPVEGWSRPQWRPRQLSPQEVSSVSRALVDLQGRLQPAPVARILYHVGRLLAHWGDQRSEIDLESVLNDWADDLEGHSEAHIREACSQWRRTQKWRPKVAEILGLIEAKTSRDRQMLHRANVLLGNEAPYPWETPAEEGEAEPITPQRRAEIEKLIEGVDGPLGEAIKTLLVQQAEAHGNSR